MFPSSSLAMEDHRRPNIIRGSGVKQQRPKSINNIRHPVAQSASSLSGRRRTISLSQAAQNISLPVENNFEFYQTITYGNDNSNFSGQQIMIDDNLQLIQPSSAEEEINPHLSNDEEQLVQAEIQTENGSYIMYIQDDEILGLQSESEHAEDSNLQDEQQEQNEIQGDSSNDESQTTGAENGDLQTNEHEEDGSSNYESSGLSVSSTNIVLDANSDQQEQVMADEQYIVVQLDDGNNYLIPASSLNAAGNVPGMDGEQEQIFVDSNGEQIQFVNSYNEFATNMTENFPSPVVTQNSASSMFSIVQQRIGKRENSDTVQQSSPVKRQINNDHSATATISRNSHYLPIVSSSRAGEHNGHSHSQLPLNFLETTSSSGVRRNPPPSQDAKPRPFRFEMPEDEIEPIDPSTDYLSLVIEQFQRENYNQLHK